MKLQHFGFIQILLLVAIFVSCSTTTAAKATFDHVCIKDTSISEIGSIWLDFKGENTTQPAGRLEDNTGRVDPLDNLKRYKSGQNISNKHYWSSTAFMGRFGYIVGVGWLLGGLGYVLFLFPVSVSVCSNKRKRSKSKLSSWSKKFYFWCLFTALLCTFLAIRLLQQISATIFSQFFYFLTNFH